MLYLNYCISAILLSLLILVTYYIKEKSIIYFVIILLIFLILNNILKKKKEYFNVNQTAELLRDSAKHTNKVNDLDSKMTKMQTNIDDLTDVLKQQRIKELYKKNAEAKDFDMTKSQEKQDTELDFLERELDILTNLYKNEVDSLDKDNVANIPVISSCKIKNEGQLYKSNSSSQLNPEKLVKKLENMEVLKNNGITSETAGNLYNLISNKKINDNMDINVNLL